MLTITVPPGEYFDEKNNRFINTEPVTLTLEHSLLSLSKWESIYQKPFLNPGKKTSEELLGYVVAMTLTPEVSLEVYSRLSNENLDAINEYIESPQTATTFPKQQEKKGRAEIITSELIYYWMVSYNIPFECQTWHLNRLFTLIRVCGVKQSKPTKMSKSEAAAQRRAINDQRRQQWGTSG